MAATMVTPAVELASNKSKRRVSLESQFFGNRPFRDFVNPLKPSEKCHKLQVRASHSSLWHHICA
jgi:hypothetical protein